MGEPDTRSDEQLWAQARAGDAAAFAAVFDRHVDAVHGHCLRWTGNWADAEDLTSMVFFESWRKAGRVRFVDGSIRPWLMVVGTNLARTLARSRRRYRAMLARLPREEASPDAADEVLTDLASEERAQRLTAALATLTRADQSVISLCDLAELTYEQAAEVLEVPVGTVRSRLSRARRRLRNALDHDQQQTSPAPLSELASRRSLT